MGWNLAQADYRVFPRNPLRAVIIQLRFHPVLKVGARIADFQDIVRAGFPVFEDNTNRIVEFNPLAGVLTRDEKEYRFQSLDRSATVVLGVAALALESRRHSDRDSLFAQFGTALNALDEVYKPIAPTRLGLRYINVIDRSAIAGDLGRELTWKALVSAPFLQLPVVDDLSDTLFASEISAPLGQGGMTARYGLLRDPDGGGTRFRLDVDRYVEGALDPAQVTPTLRAFADDIYSMFRLAAGDDLLAWMSQSAENPGDPR